MSTLPARRHRRVVVPIDLGGSPTACAVRPPLRPRPVADTVAALVAHYAAERRPQPDTPLEVAFFHGGLPTVDLVTAAGGHALRLAVQPADVEREDAEALRRRGLQTVEVEALTLHDAPLRDLRRGYGRARVEGLIRGLKELGFRVGLTLWPGLPGTSHAMAVEDADRAVALRVDFVRLQPALALAGSELAERARQGRWRPMRLGEAVTTVTEMADRLEAGGVQIARIGLQPGSDLPVAAVAGPADPDLRGKVEARRFRKRMQTALHGARHGVPEVLVVHPADLQWAKGTNNANVRALRASLRLDRIELQTDPALARGEVRRRFAAPEPPPSSAGARDGAQGPG